MATQQGKASAVQKHRAAMRRKGMKLVQLWVPDPEAPGFADECRRQLAVITKAAADPSSAEARDNAVVGSLADELLAGEPAYDWGPEGPPK